MLLPLDKEKKLIRQPLNEKGTSGMQGSIGAVNVIQID